MLARRMAVIGTSALVLTGGGWRLTHHDELDRAGGIGVELLEHEEVMVRACGRCECQRRERKAKLQHPDSGTLIPTARQQLDELHTFLSRNPVVSMPDSGTITVAPTPEFFRWSSASMWTPGPFESRPSRAMYYLTDVDPKWESEKQLEHLRDFNLPTLWTISIHEVYPGHFLHYQFLRKVDSVATPFARWLTVSTSMDTPRTSESRTNSWRTSSHLCPVAVRNSMPSSHSASVRRVSLTNA